MKVRPPPKVASGWLKMEFPWLCNCASSDESAVLPGLVDASGRNQLVNERRNISVPPRPASAAAGML
jgi:hypothetical protein